MSTLVRYVDHHIVIRSLLDLVSTNNRKQNRHTRDLIDNIQLFLWNAVCSMYDIPSEMFYTVNSKLLCLFFFPQQGLPDCCDIQHSDLILCRTCDLLCDRFPGPRITSWSEKSGRSRGRSCLYCIPRSGNSATGLTAVVTPLLCDATHSGARLPVCSHGDCDHCYTGPLP